MELDVKASHRKSRAPWMMGGSGNKTNNPYAAANTSVVSNDNDTLQLPKQYYNGSNSRKNNRRLSIHASAAAQVHGKSFSSNAPFDASKLPPVPQLNKVMSNVSEAASGEEKEKDDFSGIEMKIVKELSNGSATEIDDYYKVLLKQKNLITRDIKSNINENQKNILELTDDLRETKEELLRLRVSTKELYEILSEFTDSAKRRLEMEDEGDQKAEHTFAPIRSRKKKDRSSILVLEKMWRNELQSLFKHVEGATKFVQPSPGRHVLAESGRWFEINIGTRKPTKTVHLFVLNDILLIATKKTAQDSSSKSRLQAINGWPLNQVELIEMNVPESGNKADDRKSYLINIKSRSLSFIFETDRYDHFFKITEAYSKGKNELLQKNRLIDTMNENGGGASPHAGDDKMQLRRSLRNSGAFETSQEEKRKSGTNRQSSEIVLQDISARVHSRNRSHDFNRNPLEDKSRVFNDLRTIEDRLDEVDVEIAHNKFTESVGLLRYIENKLNSIESAERSSNASRGSSKSNQDEVNILLDVIKLKINHRKKHIQESLGFDLEYNVESLSNSEVHQIIEYFYLFEQLDAGIELYMKAMSKSLTNNKSRLMLSIQGSTKIDIVSHLSNLVIINIAVVKRAITIYQECIVPILKKDNRSNANSSVLTNWCIKEISKLSTTVKKYLSGSLLVKSGFDANIEMQVYKVKDRKAFNEFLEIIIPQLESVKEVGMNLDFLFDDILSLKESNVIYSEEAF